MTYNILDFGAVSDGNTVNTSAIQKAVDLCAEAGGGKVVVPAGTFISGTIWLKSNIEFCLEPGAILKGSPNLDDYNAEDAFPQNWSCPAEEWNGAHLFLAIGVENVLITGGGTLDGNGQHFFCDPKPFIPESFIWRQGLALAKDKKRLRPGQMLFFCESRNIRLEQISIQNSPCWTCFFYGCDNVFVSRILINNPPYAANTDGINIDSCHQVIVSDCQIITGDDAIAIRASPRHLTDKNRSCENIAISNCVLSSASSVFRIGVGNTTIRNIVISNIIILSGGVGFHFMASLSAKEEQGVTISGISISNVRARDVGHPFIVHGISRKAHSQVSDIVMDGFAIECFANAIIAGTSNSRPHNITLRNGTLKVIKNPVVLDDPAKYPEMLIQISSADHISLQNVSADYSASGSSHPKSTIQSDCTNVSLRDCQLECRKSPFDASNR